MFSYKVILALFLATMSIHNVSSDQNACDDTEGVIAVGSPCAKTCWWWLFYCTVECTTYTCDNIPCDSDFAKEVCPGTCTQCTTIVDIAESDTESFSTLLEFLDTAEFGSALETRGPYTVFAPTNDAFESLDQTILDNYKKPEWNRHLKSLILYHILVGKFFSSDITDGQELHTVEGSSIAVFREPFEVEDAKITSKDIPAANGVVHVIDQVLQPPSFYTNIVDYLAEGSRSDMFSTLVELVTAARRNLFSLDELFNEREEPDREPVEKNAQNDENDQNDQLINIQLGGANEELPSVPQPIFEQPPAETQLEDETPPPEETETVDDSLVTLLSSLEPQGPFTLFAPTNAAFERIEGLIDTTNEAEVTKILQYHVLQGIILSDQITDGLEAETLLGEKATFSTYSSHVIINGDACVSEKDILVSNGVIHVIDEVLLPEGYEKCSDIKDTFPIWKDVDEEYTCDDIGASLFTWWYCYYFSDYCPETCGYCS